MCGAIPPLLSWCAYGLRVGIREQDTGQLNLPSVELESVLHHCYHDKQMKHGGSASRQGAGEQSGVAAECVDREVAAGRILNGGSFTLHRNLITA